MFPQKHVYDENGKQIEIRDVWRENLEEEFAVIRELVTKYPYVAMDTEFPGVVARPIGSTQSTPDYMYQTLRCNVDLLKLIQLGVAFADENGQFAEGCPCWQFHFKFSIHDDMYAQDSIDLLVRSGIQFDLHEKEGIEVDDFGELMISSGLVLCPEVTWISFHGGYDFGYLLKVLTCKTLPPSEEQFFELLHTYFPCSFDLKHIMTNTVSEEHRFKGGLNRLAEILEVNRIGPEHQAGSDSMLTAAVFFKMREKYFDGSLQDVPQVDGIIHGLGAGITNTANSNKYA